MSILATNRLARELANLKKYKNDCNIEIEEINSDLFHLKARMSGPPDTPYSDANYELDIKIPEKYPFVPPKARFLTRIWHPNISSITGLICLDILKDKWSASMTIMSLLMSILALMQDPAPDDPQDGQVAKQYIKNKEDFQKTAEYWKCYFAQKLSNEERIEKFPDYEKKLSILKKKL